MTSLLRLTWVPLVFLLACDGDDAAPEPCSRGSGRQPVARFPSGSTFALPAIDLDQARCAGAAWELSGAPDGNLNAIVAGEAGARFTPHVPGEHRFRLGATGEELTVTVIDGAAVPFQHFNYYPGRSIAVVDGETWTADVYSPTVTAIDADGVAAAPIVVGGWPVAIAWRDGMDVAVVAQRATDDLGLVDAAGRRIVDAIPVGDEPADVVVAPDGRTAYVSLAVSGAIAVVDLEAREVSRRIELLPDVRPLALSPDGARLYAARLRSGQPEREPFADTPVDDERDVFVIDTATGAIERELIDVGATIRHLEVSGDGDTLYVARLRNETRGNLLDGVPHFMDEIVRVDAATGEVLAVADLGRQDGSGGFAVSLQGAVEHDGLLWVAAEASDVVVAIDAVTLEEVRRVEAAGRPRAIAVTAGGALRVHGPQGFVVTEIDPAGGAPRAIATTRDPRPAPVARGQALFTGPGEGYGAAHACNSCHAEGLTDRLVWKVGPVDEFATPRPLFWLEGTYPLGWPAYLSDVRNWGYEGGSTIGVRPTTDEAEDLGAYLAALMPPPAANDWTARDGSLSAEAEAGRALFEGDAGCVTCHRAPLFTNRRFFDEGVTPGPTDVPSLVGVYRHGVWLKNGEARTLEDAIGAVGAWLEAELSDEQIAALARYVRELTARDFFLLTSAPRHRDEHVAADRPITLTFSAPVWDDPTNLARLRLVDGDGAEVAVTAEADGRHVTLTPAAPLAHGAAYRVEIGEGFESFGEQRVLSDAVELEVAAAPGLALDGTYRWTFGVPGFDPVSGEFDPDNPTPLTLTMTATPTPSGATLVFDLGEGLTYERHAVIDGDQLVLPPLPVPVGPSLADTSPAPGTLFDDDGDGVADRVEGTLMFTGPGFRFEDLAWTVSPPAVGCEEGATGGVTVTATPTDEGGASISWSGDADAIALYVTAPGAILPMGPGQTVQGDAYWVIQTSAFPSGFASPVTYGVVPDGATDTSAMHDAELEALEPGTCYMVSVTTTGFVTGSLVVRWPGKDPE